MKESIYKRLHAKNRFEFWANLLGELNVKKMAEVGVFKGAFSKTIFSQNPQIKKYYMLDPWRHLDDWNQKGNRNDKRMQQSKEEALENTAKWRSKTTVLQGTTLEKIDEIRDKSLDFVYIDGDHSLTGVTIDAINAWKKIKVGGCLGGDDLSESMWLHGTKEYEPVLIFPWIIYFAESVGAPIHLLPHNQFLIEKTKHSKFKVINHTDYYQDQSILGSYNRD